MKLRKADIKDINQLVEMRIGYLKEDYGTLSEEQIGGISEQLPSYFKSHLNKDLYVYVAECNGEIISTVFMLVVEKPANPSFLTGKTGTFLNVYTKENFRKKGIANSLVETALKDAEKLSLSYVDLQATKDGYSLYLKNNFKEQKSEYTYMKYNIQNY